MATTKKNAKRVGRILTSKGLKPVRLALSETDHKRLDRVARERGLNKASYARQAVLERLKSDEGGSAK